MNYVIGIDIGSTSVRGALVTVAGKIEKIYTQEITTWNPKPKFYQQSSDEIWSACCTTIKQLIKGISLSNVKGLGFVATSSLVVLNGDGEPISVNINDAEANSHTQNVILWLDHRAEKETNFINETKHPLLKNTGGVISIETMIPKLLWLKNNHSEIWKKSEYFFLLPDFLTWRATGSDYRSLCCASNCNYQYSYDVAQWNDDFFESITLSDLRNQNWKKIGSKVIRPGELCGKLTIEAASDTGLLPGIPVSTSMIDAHAGGIGVMGCLAENVSADFSTRIAMTCGTSTCLMAQSIQEVYVQSMRGPYYSTMVPDMWLFSGGQSASGKLVDHIINSHPVINLIKKKIKNLHVTEYLNGLLNQIADQKGLKSVDELTRHIHVWPDFHGNRSPLADSSIRGMIHGLTLDRSEEDLAVLYLATIQALAYSTKFILDTMKKAGHDTIESLIVCGGLSKNDLFVKTHANATGFKVLVPEESESVLLGAAELAASAAGIYPNLRQAMLSMAGSAKVVTPDSDVIEYHEKKYRVFLEMLNNQLRCKMIMENESS